MMKSLCGVFFVGDFLLDSLLYCYVNKRKFYGHQSGLGGRRMRGMWLVRGDQGSSRELSGGCDTYLGIMNHFFLQ